MSENGGPHLGHSPSIIEEDNQRRREAQEAEEKRLQEEASHFVYDEHSGRITGDMAARDGGVFDDRQDPTERGFARANRETVHTARMDMRAFYNQMGSENRSALEKISGGGRMIFEGLLKIPGINRVTAKIGMRCEQFWLERRNEKTRKIGFKIQRLEAQSKVNQKIAANMERDPKRGFIKDRILDLRKAKIAKLEREKEKFEAEIATHEASAKLYAEKRDQVADWLIAYYGEKITPLETKREKLKADLERFDNENEPLEQQFKEWEAEIKDLESQKAESIKELAATGMSAKEVAKEVAYFDKLIREMHNELKERDELRRRRASIEQKIAKANEKLVKMDRRKEFIDAKNSKALIFNQKREAAVGQIINEAAEEPGPVREEAVLQEEESLPEEDDGAAESEVGAREENAGGEARVESGAETFKVGDALADWNAYISEKVAKGFRIKPVIDAAKFLQKNNLQESELVGLDDIKQRIRDFYDTKYPTEAALKSDINWVLESWTGKKEITEAVSENESLPGGGAKNNEPQNKENNDNFPEKAAKVDNAAENGSESNADQNVKNKSEPAQEVAENKTYPAQDLAKAWNIFTKKNAGAANHLDLTVNLKDLAKENKDLGENLNLKRFKKAVFDYFVTNSLGGDQYKKAVEQSLENFAKQADSFITAAESAKEEEKNNSHAAADKNEGEAEHKADGGGAEREGDDEQDAEIQKFGIEDLGQQWLDFAKKKFAANRNMNVLFKPAELRRATGVPGDGIVSAKEFRAILILFYEENFNFGKGRGGKQELENAINEFVEENEENEA